MDKSNKKSAKRITRVALRPVMEKTLTDWSAQIKELYPAFEPSHSDLVGWAIEHLPVLSKKDILEIKHRYFDEVRELETLLAELRRAKAGGDQQLVNNLLGTISFRRLSPPEIKTKSEGADSATYNDR